MSISRVSPPRRSSISPEVASAETFRAFAAAKMSPEVTFSFSFSAVMAGMRSVAEVASMRTSSSEMPSGRVTVSSFVTLRNRLNPFFI